MTGAAVPPPDVDAWARFRHRPSTGATRAEDHRSLAETSRGWITAAW